jgi:hypothetical protein
MRGKEQKMKESLTKAKDMLKHAAYTNKKLLETIKLREAENSNLVSHLSCYENRFYNELAQNGPRIKRYHSIGDLNASSNKTQKNFNF